MSGGVSTFPTFPTCAVQGRDVSSGCRILPGPRALGKALEGPCGLVPCPARGSLCSRQTLGFAVLAVPCSGGFGEPESQLGWEFQPLLGVGKVLASLGSARTPAALWSSQSHWLPSATAFPVLADLWDCFRRKFPAKLISLSSHPGKSPLSFHEQEEPGTARVSLDVTPLSLALSIPEITGSSWAGFPFSCAFIPAWSVLVIPGALWGSF